jgi:hypothetical protein
MGYERKIVRASLGLALLVTALPAAAASKEPLVVTTLPDPDPNFVPPPVDKHPLRMAQLESDDASASIDDAMREFGQAIGQASLAQQQALQERCRAKDEQSAASTDDTPAPADDQTRMAWEAACKYLRR